MDEAASEPEDQVEVYKHNRLIDGRFRLSINGLRVFALGVTKLKPGKAHGSSIVSFTTQEYSDLLESSSNSLHADLRETARELVGAKVSIPLDDNRQKPAKRRGWLEATLVSAAHLNPRTGVFRMEFSEMLSPWIFSLQRNFVRYELQYAMSLTSCYAFRLYELVKSWQGNVDEKGRHRPFTVRLDDLRKTLGIEKTEYLKFSHFRARVLDDSIKQMERHTDISFSYKAIKESRAVVALELTLLPRVSTQPAAPVPEEQPDSQLPRPRLMDYVAKSTNLLVTASGSARVGRPADPIAAAEARVKSQRFALDAAEARVKSQRLELDAAKNADPLDEKICATCEVDLAQAEAWLAKLKALQTPQSAI